ncbi:GroES-like protein [Gonapodya prolifera JEL478]|uniref:GroES-like protein n=1 Tax=Gonapodya prolifera (strain JEL478) TaxID=1344416 RepID=A0A139AH59_GONPJ|nr:GroES-like protein [Gonapodya prolifera JEL478]|eukprot:KXS16151.1 GroES-like protein [Gonapodya prolifera JEL478]
MGIPKVQRAVLTGKGGGPPSALSVGETAVPTIKDNDLLVKVAAAGVNQADTKVRKQVMPGLVAPQILGKDYCGTVVAVGTGVQGYSLGDTVYGQLQAHGGAYAEYMVVDVAKDYVAKKPDSLSDAVAAGIPMGALTAYSGWVTYGGLKVPEGPFEQGPRVLVIGASGTVGHLATQMAKTCLGASLVVGVCSAKNAPWVKDMGCDEVIVYDATDEKGGKVVEAVGTTKWPEWKESFDLIYDTVGRDDLYLLWSHRLLKPSSRWVTCAFPVAEGGARRIGVTDLFAFAWFMGQKAIAGARKWQMVWEVDPKGWPMVTKWVDEGKLTVHIQESLPFSEAPRAHTLVEEGHVAGKVVLVPS